MTTTNFFSSPFFAIGGGGVVTPSTREHSALPENKEKMMDDTIYICKFCGQPLGEMEFTGGFCLRCDNTKCRLFGEHQGIRNRSGEEGEAYRQRRKSRIFMTTAGGDRRCKELSPERRAAMECRKARPGYQPWMEQKKRNYHTLKDLGYGCQEAMANSSKKRMKKLGINAEMPKRLDR